MQEIQSSKSQTAMDAYAPAFFGLLATRLIDRLVEDGARIAEARGIVTPPRCMSTIITLVSGPLGVSEIGRQLGVSHVAVIKNVRMLIDHGLARTRTDPEDARRKPVELTIKGQRAARDVAQLLQSAQQVYCDIFAEIGVDVYDAMINFEKAICQRSFADRLLKIESVPG